MKLVLNTWLLALVEGLAEIVALAEGLGVDPAAFLEIIEGGPLVAPYAKIKGTMMIERSYEPSFSLALAAKDAGLVARGGRRAGLELPLPRAIREQMGKAVDAGHGDDDMAAARGELAPWPARSSSSTSRTTSRPAARWRSPAATRSPGGSTSSPRSGDYDLVVATRDWHPPDHGSFTEQGGIWPVHCVAGHRRAPQLHPALDAAAVDVIVDKGQDRDTEGYSGFEAPTLAELLRERGVDRGDGRRAGHGLLRQEHRARRAAGGLRRHRRHDRGARRRRRAGRLRARAGRAARGGRRAWREPCAAADRLVERAARQHRRRARAGARSRAVPRDAVRPARRCAARRGTTCRCRSAAARRSPSRSSSRACASCWSSRGDERVLDVGTGSGYHAALLGAAGRTRSTRSSCTPRCPTAPRRRSAAAGVANVTLVGRRRLRAGCPSTRRSTRSTSPRRPAARPARAAWTSSRRAAGSSRRSRTRRPAARRCCTARAAARARRGSSACASCRCVGASRRR